MGDLPEALSQNFKAGEAAVVPDPDLKVESRGPGTQRKESPEKQGVVVTELFGSGDTRERPGCLFELEVEQLSGIPQCHEMGRLMVGGKAGQHGHDRVSLLFQQ
jgi:hypothetical protein